MVLLANILNSLGVTVNWLLGLLFILVIIRGVLSWVSPDPSNPIVRFIWMSTDPLLRPIQRRLPLVAGGVDLSPIVLFLVIIFLQTFIVGAAVDYAMVLRMEAVRAGL